LVRIKLLLTQQDKHCENTNRG